MPERRAQLKSFVTRSRCCKDLVGVIYAVGGQTKSGNSLSTVEVYDPIAGRCPWPVMSYTQVKGRSC